MASLPTEDDSSLLWLFSQPFLLERNQSIRLILSPLLTTVTVPAFKQATAADVTLEVQVFHKVLTLNSISSSDGRITQSISI